LFKFENPTPVQTPAAIEATENYQCFYFTNDHTDSCYYSQIEKWLRFRVQFFKNFPL